MYLESFTRQPSVLKQAPFTSSGFPSSFISIDALKPLLSPLLEERRPMDNMRLSWELPAEDEIATTVLSGGISPYTAIVMPREEKRCLRSLYSFGLSVGNTQSGEAEPGVGRGGGPCAPRTMVSLLSGRDSLAWQFREWQESFLSFMRKVRGAQSFISDADYPENQHLYVLLQITFWHSLQQGESTTTKSN